MTNTIFGTKQQMTEAYLGVNRVAVTRIKLSPMTVSHLKSAEKDGYQAAQVVFGEAKKRTPRSLAGHLKASKAVGRFIREVEVTEGQAVGDTIMPASVVSAGSVVSVQGVSKGKGFAGGIKRWGFHGGPKTHGQSDRHRAPGSVGQGTTPGRVHRNKKMAGHMGSDTVTVKNVMVVAADKDYIWVTGPVPGAAGTLIKLTVTGKEEVPSLTFLSGYNPVSDENTEAAVTAETEPASTESAPADSANDQENSL